MEKMKNDTRSRSWFVVIANPQEHSEMMKGKTEQECCEILNTIWCSDDEKSSASLYCKSKDGLLHIHQVIESKNVVRFSNVKKYYESIGLSPHIEPTKGNKEQVEDYIHKRGAFEEKGEVILATAQKGEIKGRQGKRTDLERIKDLITDGMTPNQILDSDVNLYRNEKYITEMFYKNRLKTIGGKERDVKVHWEFGESGSGKTHIYIELCEKYGKDEVYLVNCNNPNLWDNYNGQKYVVMDEFRGGAIKFGELLTLLDVYPQQLHARYCNKYMLWSEVYITTTNPPDIIYSEMLFDDKQGYDKCEQLFRRITDIAIHSKEKDENGKNKYAEHRVDARAYFEWTIKLIKQLKNEFNMTKEQMVNAFITVDRENTMKLHFDEIKLNI